MPRERVEAPYIPADLIEFLYFIYPNELPVHFSTDKEFARLQGQQDVIRRLVGEMKEQENS